MRPETVPGQPFLHAVDPGHNLGARHQAQVLARLPVDADKRRTEGTPQPPHGTV